MNKEKIVEELNEYVKGLNSKLSVKHDADGALVLRYNRSCHAWFCNFDRSQFIIHADSDLGALFIKEGYLTNFYNKAIELMDKYGAKYTIQVIKHDCGSYLNFNKSNGKYILHNTVGFSGIKTHFTKSEIEELKKRGDIAIDWDKAIIKEVTD